MDAWSEAAVEQNRRWLTAYALTMTGDPVAAEDIVQDVFAVAYEKRNSFKHGTNFGGWLRTIARNVILRHCEARKRRPLVDQEEALEKLDRLAAESCARNLDPDLAQHRTQSLRECLKTIGGKVQKLLEQRYGLGLSSAEVAATTGQSVSAVNVAMFRARAALAECLRRKEKR